MWKKLRIVLHAVLLLRMVMYWYTWCCVLTYFEITDSNCLYMDCLHYRINYGLCFCQRQHRT